MARMGIDIDEAKEAKFAKGAELGSKTKRFTKKADSEEASAEAPKKSAKAKAAKPAKAKSEAKESTDNRKIKLLTKENPKREGSASYDRYELYRTSKTVADFIAAGGSAADIRYDEAKGHIEVA